MTRYWAIVGLMLALFLGLFLIVEALQLPLLSDPSPWLDQRGPAAALVGVGLLTADVVLPVPSSLVMVAHGALFGVVLGTLLSLLGGMGAAWLGFAMGRRGGPVLSRFTSPEERRRVDHLIERWGALAVVVTRPVPMLAETTAIVAGASPMGWRKLTLAALAGSLPPALVYAVAGSFAASFASAALVFVLVLLATGLFWLLGRRFESRTSEGTRRRDSTAVLASAERTTE
jgi:uncharacterized membrane protein YdjX (TVP38/TMEM64 family)